MNGKKTKHIRSISLYSLTLVAYLIGIAGFFYQDALESSDRFYLRSTAGDILFEHKKHIKTTENCADCHHNIIFSDERTSCSECHDDDFSEEDFIHTELKDIEEHTCTGCHRTDESKKPENCRFCHSNGEDFESSDIKCIECHDSNYTPELLTHDEMQDIEGHQCTGCHQPKNISDIYHSQCNTCHKKNNQDIFFDSEGKISCNRCHLK